MKNLYTIAVALILASTIFAQKRDTLDINLTQYKYPYTVKFDTLRTQQQILQMAYMYEATGDSKGTVMLLHGKNFNGAYWGETMKSLLAKGYNVFVPDQVGFGKSSKPKNYQYSFNQLAENTKKILDKLKIGKVIVLGHSMGGMLATRFTLMFPDRVEQLILENPIGLEDWRKWVPYQDIDLAYQREMKKSAEGARQYMLMNYFHNEWKPEYDELVYLQTAFLKSPEYPTLAWNAALTYDMIITQPVVYEFQNLKTPTVLILGQLDRTALGKEQVAKDIASQMGNYPKLGKEISGKIPNCKLIELQGLGHIPHVENFSVFFDSLMKEIKP